MKSTADRNTPATIRKHCKRLTCFKRQDTANDSHLHINTLLYNLVPWPSIDIQGKFYGDRPRGTPPSRELNTTGVAKYSDFGPIEGYYLGNGAR